jgi:hypothetical protein
MQTTYKSNLDKPAMGLNYSYVVYGLFENNILMYVGLTRQRISDRLHCHLLESRNPLKKDPKNSWIRKCSSLGIKIEMRPLRVNLTQESAVRIERQIIRKLRPKLTNSQSGGQLGSGLGKCDLKVRVERRDGHVEIYHLNYKNGKLVGQSINMSPKQFGRKLGDIFQLWIAP